MLQFRDTSIVRSGSLKGTTAAGVKLDMTRITDIYLCQVFGMITSNVWMAIHGTDDEGTELVYTSAVDISQGQWKGVSWPQARTVSNSLTVDWIGTELNRGGYFEAAYLPLDYANPTTSSGTKHIYTVDLSRFGSYTSYTASSEQGAYVVGAINSYDQYKWWRSGAAPLVTMNISFGASKTWPVAPGGGADMSLQPYGPGTRVSVVRYVPPSNTSEFVLRYTSNAAVEVMASPAQGGGDGAIYDPGAIEMYRTLVDQMVLMFPASYNDLGVLWQGLRALIPKVPAVMKALTGFVPSLKQSRDIFRLWLEGVSIPDALRVVGQGGFVGAGGVPTAIPMAANTRTQGVVLSPGAAVKVGKKRARRLRALARASVL